MTIWTKATACVSLTLSSWALAAPSPEAVIETSKGTIVVRLLPELAPLHVQHFVKTIKAKGYDHTTFHRVIQGGIIQGGDPLSKDPRQVARYGQGGLGLLKAEFSERPFTRGVVAAARRPGDNNSGGTQFFIVLTEQKALKGQYTIFGEVTSGIEVADEISRTPVSGDTPRVREEMKIGLQDAQSLPADSAP
jgi:peptidyl-prolyl cis-trans isomerase B (cyclophilin B)